MPRSPRPGSNAGNSPRGGSQNWNTTGRRNPLNRQNRSLPAPVRAAEEQRRREQHSREVLLARAHVLDAARERLEQEQLSQLLISPVQRGRGFQRCSYQASAREPWIAQIDTLRRENDGSYLGLVSNSSTTEGIQHIDTHSPTGTDTYLPTAGDLHTPRSPSPTSHSIYDFQFLAPYDTWQFVLAPSIDEDGNPYFQEEFELDPEDDPAYDEEIEIHYLEQVNMQRAIRNSAYVDMFGQPLPHYSPPQLQGGEAPPLVHLLAESGLRPPGVWAYLRSRFAHETQRYLRWNGFTSLSLEEPRVMQEIELDIAVLLAEQEYRARDHQWELIIQEMNVRMHADGRTLSANGMRFSTPPEAPSPFVHSLTGTPPRAFEDLASPAVIPTSDDEDALSDIDDDLFENYVPESSSSWDATPTPSALGLAGTASASPEPIMIDGASGYPQENVQSRYAPVPQTSIDDTFNNMLFASMRESGTGPTTFAESRTDETSASNIRGSTTTRVSGERMVRRSELDG